MPFSKQGINVDVSEIPDDISDKSRNEAYAKLVREIKKIVLRGDDIDPDHDFREFYSLRAK